MIQKLYLDENVSATLAVLLASFGYDIVTTHELGNKGVSDVRQLLLVTRQGRTIVTHDARHYEMLHEAWLTCAREWSINERCLHAGIIVIPAPKRLPVAEAGRVINALARREESLDNRLLAWGTASGWTEINHDG